MPYIKRIESNGEIDSCYTARAKTGYRADKAPTGQEVKNIVKFFYGMHTEQLKALSVQEEKRNKKTSALIAVSTLAIVITVWTATSYLKKSIAFWLTPISSTSSSE